MSQIAILGRLVSRTNGKYEFEPVVKGELSIPLTIAHLCQSCDSIVGSCIRCPDCGSTALLNLSKVLNR